MQKLIKLYGGFSLPRAFPLMPSDALTIDKCLLLLPKRGWSMQVWFPGYESMRTTQLNLEYQVVSQQLEGLKNNWKVYGCTIATDGWTDARRRPVINFMVSSVNGSMFLKSVNTSCHDIFKLVEEVLYEVGVENVVQVITDNASNCVGMGRMLEEKYPTIVYGRCVCHCLDLLFHDVGNLEWVTPVVAQAKALVTFITKKERVLAIYRKFCVKDLAKPSDTRFAYIFLCLGQLLDKDVHTGLWKMMTSDEWASHPASSTTAGRSIEHTVFDEGFWMEAQQILVILGPCLKLLKLANREGATMGLIFEMMDQMVESLDKLVADGIVEEEKISAIKSFLMIDHGARHARWHMLHNCLQSAAHLLHPLWVKENMSVNDPEAIEGWMQYVKKYTTDLELQLKLYSQMKSFRNGKIPSLTDPVARKREAIVHSVEWWEMFGDALPDLQTLALRVLSQPCSSSSCERNWSAWSYN